MVQLLDEHIVRARLLFWDDFKSAGVYSVTQHQEERWSVCEVLLSLLFSFSQWTHILSIPPGDHCGPSQTAVTN